MAECVSQRLTTEEGSKMVDELRSMVTVIQRLRDPALFFGVILFAVLSLVEVSARLNAGRLIGVRKAAVYEQLVRLPTANNDSSIVDRDRLIAETGCLSTMESRLVALILTGTSEPRQVATILMFASTNCQGTAEAQDGTLGPGFSETNSMVDRFVRAFVDLAMIPQRMVERMANEHLIALAVVLCGILGTSIASARAGTAHSGRELLLGLGAGVIVFLGIKGGGQVFLINGDTIEAGINAYTASFAGLLAGLFTERTFDLLSSVFDALATKLKSAFSE